MTTNDDGSTDMTAPTLTRDDADCDALRGLARLPHASREVVLRDLVRSLDTGRDGRVRGTIGALRALRDGYPAPSPGPWYEWPSGRLVTDE